MKKIIYFTLSVLTLFSTSTFASASNSPMGAEEELSSSIASLCFGHQGYTSEQLKKIAKLTSSSQEREIPMQGSPKGRDFGYDFSKRNATKTMSLLAIQTCSLTHPVCYDLGGGYGGDSLNMVLAGGNVTYIEHHPDVAATARLEVYGALRDISVDEKQKKELWGRLRMVRADFLDTDNTMLYPKSAQINICNLSNVLHFLTPTQIETFLPALFTKMAPDGIVFASMHVPCDNKKVIDFFLTQKEKGNPYPGYFRHTRNYEIDGIIEGKGAYRLKERRDFNDAEPALKGDLPGTKISQTFVPPFPHKPKAVNVKNVIHYFDPDIAAAAFKRAGFTVQKAFFFSRFGEPLEGVKATKEAFLAGNYHMMIIASKSK